VNRFDVGDVATLGNPTTAVNADADPDWEAFLDKLNQAADPTTVTITVTKPDGTVTTYAYNGTPALTRESIGRYWVDVALDQPGTWKWTFTGTGNVATSQTYAFTVRAAGQVSG